MKIETIERAFILNSHASLTTLNDAFNEHFEKLYALVKVSLGDNFSDYPKSTTYHYRAVINDILDEIRELQKAIMQKSNKGKLTQ